MATSRIAWLAGLAGLLLLSQRGEPAAPAESPEAPAQTKPEAPVAEASTPTPTQLPPALPVEAPPSGPVIQAPPAPEVSVPQAAIVDLSLARIFAGLTAHHVIITGIQADEELFGPQIALTPGDRIRAIIKVRNIGGALGRFRVRAGLYLGGTKVADLFDVRNQWSTADTTLPAGSTGTLVMESLPLPFPGQLGQGQVNLDLLLLVTTLTDLGELGATSYILREAMIFREVA